MITDEQVRVLTGRSIESFATVAIGTGHGAVGQTISVQLVQPISGRSTIQAELLNTVAPSRHNLSVLRDGNGKWWAIGNEATANRETVIQNRRRSPDDPQDGTTMAVFLRAQHVSVDEDAFTGLSRFDVWFKFEQQPARKLLSDLPGSLIGTNDGQLSNTVFFNLTSLTRSRWLFQLATKTLDELLSITIVLEGNRIVSEFRTAQTGDITYPAAFAQYQLFLWKKAFTATGTEELFFIPALNRSYANPLGSNPFAVLVSLRQAYLAFNRRDRFSLPLRQRASTLPVQTPPTYFSNFASLKTLLRGERINWHSGESAKLFDGSLTNADLRQESSKSIRLSLAEFAEYGYTPSTLVFARDFNNTPGQPIQSAVIDNSIHAVGFHQNRRSASFGDYYSDLFALIALGFSIGG